MRRSLSPTLARHFYQGLVRNQVMLLRHDRLRNHFRLLYGVQWKTVCGQTKSRVYSEMRFTVVTLFALVTQERIARSRSGPRHCTWRSKRYPVVCITLRFRFLRGMYPFLRHGHNCYCCGNRETPHVQCITASCTCMYCYPEPLCSVLA